MFHKAFDLKYKEGTTLEVYFQTGEVKSYDMAKMFQKYPQMKALEDRSLFTSGKLIGGYGIIWNDELDFEIETIYQDGQLERIKAWTINYKIAAELQKARAKANLSQKELSSSTGIDQSDLSKIERGLGNPSLSTLNRIATALGMELKITFEPIVNKSEV